MQARNLCFCYGHGSRLFGFRLDTMESTAPLQKTEHKVPDGVIPYTWHFVHVWLLSWGSLWPFKNNGNIRFLVTDPLCPLALRTRVATLPGVPVALQNT